MTKRALFSLLPVVVLAVGTELGFRLFFTEASTLDYVAKAAEPPGGDASSYFWLHRSQIPRVRSRSRPPAPPVDVGATGANGALIRIVAIGGSSAAGYPYDPRLAFPNVLRVMLQAMYPDTRFQVINLARFAAPFSVTAQSYFDAAHLRPRFLLIYSGHNELYPHNLAQVVERRGRSGMSRAVDAVAGGLGSRSRALGWVLDRSQQSGYSVPDGFNPFEHLGDLLANFRETTARIHDTATRTGTTVVFGTLVRNLKDFPPIPYSQTVADAFPPLEPEQFEALSGVDRRNPVNLFRAARWHEAQGELELAERRFVAAADRVTRLARVHSSLQAWIEQAADFHPGVVVEAERFVGHAAGARLVGDDEIFDWVHPKLATSYLLAVAYVEGMRPALDDELGAPVRGPPTLVEIKPRLANAVRALESDGEIEAGFVNVQVGRPDIASALFERGLGAAPSPAMTAKALVGLALLSVRADELERARAVLDRIDDEARPFLDEALGHYRQLDRFDELRALVE